MSDVSNESSVMECEMPPGWGHRPQPQQERRPLAGHWSQRVPDPLGTALARLDANRQALEVVQGLVETVQDDLPGIQTVEHTGSDKLQVTVQDPVVVRETFSTGERRRFPRRHSECEVTLIDRRETVDLTPQETDWLLQSSRNVGRLLDISQTGVCLLLEHDVPVDTEVLLRISNHQLNRHVDSEAKVIHSMPADEGKFSIHCQILRDFSLDELQDLGRPLIHSHPLA